MRFSLCQTPAVVVGSATAAPGSVWDFRNATVLGVGGSGLTDPQIITNPSNHTFLQGSPQTDTPIGRFYVLASWSSIVNDTANDITRLMIAIGADKSHLRLISTNFYTEPLAGVMRDPKITNIKGTWFVSFTCNVSSRAFCMAKSSDLAGR